MTRNFFSRLSQALSNIAVAIVVAASTPAIAQDASNPYVFEKKAVNADGTAYVGPPNVGDTINYVLTYKPDTTNSGPVTIDDQFSTNLSYFGPTTSSLGWTWGSSPYSVGNNETYSHPGYGPGMIKLSAVDPQGAGDGTIPIPIPSLKRAYGIFHHVPHSATGEIDCWELAGNKTILEKCPGYPKQTSVSGTIGTPMTPHAVVVGKLIYFAGFRTTGTGDSATGTPVIACFDAATDAPCGDTVIDPAQTTIDIAQFSGVVTDGTGRLFVAIKNQVYCRQLPSLSDCWASTSPATPSVTGSYITGYAAGPSSPDFVFLVTNFGPSTTRLYSHHGDGKVQCLDAATGQICTGGSWSSTGTGLPSGSVVNNWMLSAVPNGSADGGVCGWSHLGLIGCVSELGTTKTLSPAPVLPPTSDPHAISSFNLPGTNRIYLPSHYAGNTGVKCFEFTNSSATACAGFPSQIPLPSSPFNRQYGVAVDPEDASRCMLALGHDNIMWRLDFNTGKLGCNGGVDDFENIAKNYCHDKPSRANFKWTRLVVNTPGAAGTITLWSGSNTQPISIVSGTTTYVVPAAFSLGGYGPVVASFVKAGGSPKKVEFELHYDTGKPEQICYSAKVKECGVVSNTATMKGSFNNAAFSVAKTVDLGKAKGPQCDPVPPVQSSCLSGDPKVSCGKTPGTYVITLQTPNNGSTSPTEIELSVLTPGVTIVNPQQVYQVNSNGQIQLTIAGAAPGTSVEFDISGSRPDPKSADGMSICCAGRIKVEIPKDIECNIKPKLDVTKACLPAKPNPAGGYTAMCQIKVKSTGAFANPISIVESLLGNGKVTYVIATDPWTCAPPSVTSPAPMNCTLPGNTLNPVTDTSLIDVKVDFANADDVKKAKNCVQHVVSANALSPRYCVPFTVEEKSTVDITKKCETVTEGEFEVKDAFMSGFGSRCIITVATTGPQTGTLTFSDNLTGGTATLLSSTSTPAWTCAATSCSISGAALNQTASTSTFEIYSVFANAGQVKEGLNCAVISRGQAKLDKDCVTFDASKYDLAIEKRGQVLNEAVLGYAFELEVTNVSAAFNGNQVIEVTDIVPVGMTFTSATGTDWSCGSLPATAGQTLTCQYTGVGPAAPGASLGVITIASTLTGTPEEGKGPFKNCADVNLTAGAGITESTLANNNSCVTVSSEVVELPVYNVKIDKSGRATSAVGTSGSFEYELVVTNLDAAFAPAAKLVVTDVVPTGLSFTSATGTDWLCSTLPASSGQTVTCNYSGSGTLAQNASLPPIKISATGDMSQPFDNCGNVAFTSNSNLVDYDLQDNNSCKTIIPGIVPPIDPPDYSVACGTNVIFVVDVSGSIQAAGQTSAIQNALNNAKNKFNSTNASGVQAQAAVIAFADNATVVNPMSASTFTSSSALTFGGETNWEAGLKAARTIAASSPSPSIIVFITDGIPNKYLNVSGSVVSTSDSTLATNEAIAEVNQIYGLSPPVPIVGIGVGNVNNYLDALLGSSTAQSSFSNIYGELDQLAKQMCPDIRLSKSMMPSSINYFNNPGPHTVTITLTVSSTAGANSNVVVQDILAPELTNPSSTDPNVSISGATVAWTLPTLAANGSATTSIKAVVNPPANLACNGVSVKNWAQITHTDQAIHSTPNNMASTGPAEQDEAGAGLYLYNCEPVTPGGLPPALYVRKTSLESCYPVGQTAAVSGKPDCEFTVNVTAFNGDYTGDVNFGDAVFNASGLTSAPSAISSLVVTTDDTAIVPAVGSLCVNSFTSLPANCTQTGFTLHQNKTVTLKYKLSSPPDLAPGNYKNCFRATGSSLPVSQSDWPAFNVTTPDSQNGRYWGYCGSFSVPASTNKVKPLECDTKTAKLSGESCRCTIRGMVPVSKTSCGCPDGQKLQNGSCVVPPPPPPKCDGKTAKLSGNRCVCAVRDMVLVSKTSCDCPKGQDVRNGRCTPPPPVCKDGTRANSKGKCVSICERGSRYNTGRNRCEPVCLRGQRYDSAKNRCERVQPDCQRGARYNPRRERCEPVCSEGTRYNPKRNACVVERPACRRGEVFVPQLGECVNIMPRECPDGTRRRGPLCVPDKRDADPQPGKLCTDREGKEVPCD